MDRAPITAAVLVALRTLSFEVGDGVAPRPAAGDAQPQMPYLVLYSIDGGGFDGPVFLAPEADATLVYQVDAVGERRDQVETLADRVRGCLIGRSSSTGAFTTALTPSGYKVMDRAADGSPGGVDREGQVFSSAQRFAITVTPA
jgi:hypothetical protein